MTANKYHPTGRLYTADELKARSWALIPTYLVKNPGKPYRSPERGAKKARKAMAKVRARLGF